jgi:hypothetical protein
MTEPSALEGISVGGSVPSRRRALPEFIAVASVRNAGLWENPERDIQILDADYRASASGRGAGDAEQWAEDARGDSYVGSIGGTGRSGVGGNTGEPILASRVLASREGSSPDDPGPNLAPPHASHFDAPAPPTRGAAPVNSPNGTDRHRPSVDRLVVVESDSELEADGLESNENGCTPARKLRDDATSIPPEARPPAGLEKVADTGGASSPANPAFVPPGTDQMVPSQRPSLPPFSAQSANRIERHLTASEPDDTTMSIEAPWRPQRD